MVKLLNDFPSHVMAYKASGTVNRKEYERVVMKRVDEVARQFNALNFLVRLETGMENYSLAALLDYIKISFRHIHRWNRMAIVSDQKAVRWFYNVLSPLVPGKVAGFQLKDFEKAKAWVSEPCLVDENLWSPRRWYVKPGLAAGVVATSAMTLFSYMVSKFARRNYSEPDLLGYLIQGWNPSLGKTSSRVMGWQAHYAIGSVWALLYSLTFREKKASASSALLFGCISGATAIYCWKKLFDWNPQPLKKHDQGFYLQLFFAHLVFGVTTRKAYPFGK